MIKYKTDKLRPTKIIPVEVAREFGATVWEEITNSKGETVTIRHKKVTESIRYHDTWEDAQDYLLDMRSQEIDSLKLELQIARSEFGVIKSMKKPEEK